MKLTGKENAFPFFSYLRLHQDGISSFQRQVLTSSAQGSDEEEPSPEPRPSPSPHPQNLQVRLGIEKTLWQKHFLADDQTLVNNAYILVLQCA